jgi:hypothetical protein
MPYRLNKIVKNYERFQLIWDFKPLNRTTQSI